MEKFVGFVLKSALFNNNKALGISWNAQHARDVIYLNLDSFAIEKENKSQIYCV